MELVRLNRIVFFTPSFGNTGSEIALFNLIVRLKDFQITVISRAKGELACKLPSGVKFYDYQTFYRPDKKIGLLRRIKNRIFRPRPSLDEFLDSVIGTKKAVFYVNTILMPDVVDYLNKNKINFILHWHELQHMFVHLKPSELLSMIRTPDLIFASSTSVKNLLKLLGREGGLEISYPGIDVKNTTSSDSLSALKKSLGIDPTAFVITMSGTLDRNKNPEMFLEIGNVVKQNGFNIHLLWIGVHEETAYNYFLSKKAAEYNFENNCSWIRKIEGQEYLDYLNLADCFVLTSLQESFSIVLVEALALGKPVFSFCSGGPAEIINDKSIGALLTEYSASEMAALIEQFIKGEVSFSSKLAKERAMSFSGEIVFQRWFARLMEWHRKNNYFLFYFTCSFISCF